MKSSELLRMSSTNKEQSKLETTEKIENQVMSESHDKKTFVEIICFLDDDEEWELQAAIVAQKIENEYFGSKTTDNDK